MVCARLCELGIRGEADTAEDEAAVIADKIRGFMKECDVVITTGGVSVGQKDCMPQVIELLGANVLFHGVAMKPGSPMLAAVFENKLIFSLSGNPFAAYATLELLVIPALMKQSGRKDILPVRAQGILLGNFPKESVSRRLIRGSIDRDGVRIPRNHFSGAMGGSRGCNCFAGCYDADWEKMLSESPLFMITENMHVSALCRGEDICYIGEDISRHNTLYRAIGACIRDGENPGNYYFCTSGRAPYSMGLVVIKAGIRVLISRSAPTDLSLELARKHGLTLAGFVSENRVNLYTGREMRRKTVGLVILAGGKSSRMNGFDKSMLILGGRTFFERLSEELSFMGERRLSANTVNNGVPKGFQLVFDEEKEIGAMGGICAALKKCESGALLVVPCDTPLFTKECAELVIGELANYDACLFRVGGKLQPLNGVYNKTCIPVFEKCIRNKQYKLADSLDQLRVKIIDGKAEKLRHWYQIPCLHAHKVPQDSIICQNRNILLH